MDQSARRADVAEPPRLLTVEQFADRIAVSRATAYRLVGTGELRSLKVGRCRRIPAEAVEEFVARLAAEQGVA